MPIISKIGRKEPRVRVLILSVYGALIFGSITMLYPFLLMLSGSTKSGVDVSESNLIPRYLFNDEALYQKHLEALFNESYNSLKTAYSNPELSFQDIPIPTESSNRLLDEWENFLQKNEQALLPYCYNLGYTFTPVSTQVIPRFAREFREELKQTISPDINEINQKFDIFFTNWSSFLVVPRRYLARGNLPSDDAFTNLYLDFKSKKNPAWRTYLSVYGFYRNHLENRYVNIEKYNQAHATDYTSFSQINVAQHIDEIESDQTLVRSDWEFFIRNIIGIFWLEASSASNAAYQKFIAAKYTSVKNYNRAYHTKIADFKTITIPTRINQKGVESADWIAFLQGWKDPDTHELHKIPIEHITIRATDFEFIEFLRQKYPDLNELNHALNTDFTRWSQIHMPQQEYHYKRFEQMQGWLRWNFTTRNYVAVFETLLVHGRGLYNTLIYCVLSVISALIVNPLAAYALSRFKPAAQYKVLLFLMLTMAFPPMVTQIPTFLQLREFGMLNTFFALVLPTLANGYAIFILKGYFDALPKELYESAQIDGAGEFAIFWNITIALSKPILAVIALNAFNQAYSAFMFALLICQDSQMWTLMVWLYQLQQKSSQGIIFASLIIAALPTLVVFVFCQNVIIRGIIVPVEK